MIEKSLFRGWVAQDGLTINLNFPTSYYFRGIAQNNAGFQFKPYVELKANVYEGAEKDVLLRST